LDLKGVHHDAILGDNEPKKEFGCDAKDTLEGVQVDILLVTSLENDA
jgi:hypothetical protein